MGKTEEKIKRITAVFKSKKSMELLITVVVIAVVAGLLLGGNSGGSEPQKTAKSETLADYAQRTEKRLEEVLSTIDGAGQVEVMITYETGPEIVPVTDTTRQSNSAKTSNEDGSDINTSENQSTETVTVQQESGIGAIVLTEKQPKVRGVIVVAMGADDVRVKIELQQAVKTVLDVSLAQIDVFTMKNDDKE
ncbi:MAG: hypothetical protein ACYCX2_08790 [Christensenellales bacterium]